MRMPEKILISRTDSIGDVVLTLPMAGILKEYFPEIPIAFMGRSYTKAIIECSKHVDEFVNFDEIEKLPVQEAALKLKETGADMIIHVYPRPYIAKIARIAGIKYRIGTTGRIYHWLSCNRLVAFSRKNSDLHEAQLNMKLLKPLGILETPSLKRISELYGFDKIMQSAKAEEFIDKNKINVILHPGSRGSGREWGLENYGFLAGMMKDERFKVFVSGTEEEGSRYNKLISDNTHVIDITGKLNLPDFISFISKADVLVASSTGPLHIAAASGIHALGIYAPMRPIHPGRWAPIGKHAHYFVVDRDCSDCKVSKDCHCMREIEARKVFEVIEKKVTGS